MGLFTTDGVAETTIRILQAQLQGEAAETSASIVEGPASKGTDSLVIPKPNKLKMDFKSFFILFIAWERQKDIFLAFEETKIVEKIL